MTDITSALKKVQVEETKYAASVSEATFTKVGASINYLVDNSIEPIGTILTSFLTEAQFQSIKGNKWVLINGQNISGSDLALLTGITNLPAKVSGATIIQTDLDANISLTSTGENKSHTHSVLTLYAGGIGGSATVIELADTDVNYNNPEYTSNNGVHNWIASQGGTNNLAAGYKANIFIKINNNNT